MQKVRTFLDFIIYDIFIFIVLLIIFGSFTNGYFPLALSILGLCFFSALFFKVRGKLFSKKKTTEDTLKKQKLIETSLLYQTNFECLEFFEHFFKSMQGLELSPFGNFLQSEETIVFPCFSSLELTFEKALAISKIAREAGAKHLIIPCIKNSCNESFLSGMFETVSVFESRALFEKMIEFDFFPKMIDQKVLPKKSFKTTFSAFCDKKKARGFGGLGILLFGFALLSPFKTYYFISASVLLSLAALLLLKKR